MFNKKHIYIIFIVNLLCFLLITPITYSKELTNSKLQNNLVKPTSKQNIVAPILVIDPYNLTIFHQKNIFQRWYPASLTKLMTAFVVLILVDQNQISLNDPIIISKNASNVSPTKIGYKEGEIISVDTAIKALLTRSANDVAIALAENIAGSTAGFATLMNKVAKLIGMDNSNFDNPSGLPSANNYSTAYDLAILAINIWREFPQYRHYLGIAQVEIDNKKLTNTNPLIGRFTGANGMKTGFTCDSGFNMITSATRNENTLIVITLGNESQTERAEKTAKLLEESFTNIKDSKYLPKLNQLQPNNSETPTKVVSIREKICGKIKHQRPKDIFTKNRQLILNSQYINPPIEETHTVSLPYILKINSEKKTIKEEKKKNSSPTTRSPKLAKKHRS
ncbi:D-alanyl-D-alanine carboxypeptidase family protein [Bartonella sp. DGB1]|uniref:D-alanyl-D-alanine carboxypeptidase family protein n=1 Tax=Bartonella sp. DGB1 TaxID=3239807 RepID=UPI00352450CF